LLQYRPIQMMPQNKMKSQPSGSLGPTGRIRRAHLSMQRCADAVFTPRKVTTDQFSLLWILWRREGIRQNELADELFTDPNTVTAMLVRLEKRGLIRREVCAEDGRARRVSLTPVGRRLTSRLCEDWEPLRQKLRDIFAGEAGEEALRILEDVCTVMTESRAAILKKRRNPSRASEPRLITR
jgi:DNA-binding MarR family transcriptional regulator